MGKAIRKIIGDIVWCSTHEGDKTHYTAGFLTLEDATKAKDILISKTYVDRVKIREP
jgi:hypothetical protein